MRKKGMSNNPAFGKIMAGLGDALAYADGDASRGTAHQGKVTGVDITHLEGEARCGR
jgi:hypothetical protein